MCLERIKNKTVEIADRDITVYKFLERDGVSPFQGTPYKLHELKQRRNFTDEYENSFRSASGDTRKAIAGGFHSYTTKSGAIDGAQHNQWFAPSFVIECVIPKGTLFIKGHENNIVSLKLKVGKAIFGLKDSAKARREFNKSE